MIIQLVMTVVSGLLKLLFAWVNLPNVPDSARTAINTYLGYVFDNLSFISFFVNVSTLKIVALIAIALIVFERLYKILLWILHKIPMLNIL